MDDIKYEELNLNFDLSNADYQLDAIQMEMLQLYLRNDIKFQRAFMTNFTAVFVQYIKDKVRLGEPITISVMGNVRGGKSYGMISICIIHQALHGKLFNIKYICANEFEFIEKLREFPEDELKNAIFLIDEEKQAVYGSGSVAKKMKAEDVSNIIAKMNISVIRINPTRFPAQEVSWYGLRAFGRCFKTGTIRYMLYNLQEGERGGVRPIAMIYLPMFTKLLPKEKAEALERDYIGKKDNWIRAEMRGEGDVLSEMKKKMAEQFLLDEQFKEIKKMNEKLTYITTKLGSEWSGGEVKEIYHLTQLLNRGIKFN